MAEMLKATGQEISRKRLRFSVIGPCNYYNQTWFDYNVKTVLDAKRKGKPVVYKAHSDAGMIGMLAERLCSRQGYRQSLAGRQTVFEQIDDLAIDVLFVFLRPFENATVDPKWVEYARDRDVHIEQVYIY